MYRRYLNQRDWSESNHRPDAHVDAVMRRRQESRSRTWDLKISRPREPEAIRVLSELQQSPACACFFGDADGDGPLGTSTRFEVLPIALLLQSVG